MFRFFRIFSLFGAANVTNLFLRREILHGLYLGHDDFFEQIYAFFECVCRCVDGDGRVARCFKWCRDTREIFYLTLSGFLVEPFDISFFADFERCAYIDFEKIIGTDDVGGHLPDFFGWTDKSRYRYDTAVDEEFGHFGNAAYVFDAVGFGKS